MGFFDNRLGLGAAVLAVVALGLTAAVTLGGFSAGVANDTSTFAAGTLQLKEHNGAITCFSTGTGAGGTVTPADTNTSCAINVLGGAVKQKPGGTVVTTTIVLTNVGTAAASGGTLLLGSCTSAATAANDGGYKGTDAAFCAKVDATVQLSSTPSKCLYPKSTVAACGTPSAAGTLASLAATGSLPMPALAPGTANSVSVTVKTKLDASAGNTDQGLKATLPVTWSIHQ